MFKTKLPLALAVATVMATGSLWAEYDSAKPQDKPVPQKKYEQRKPGEWQRGNMQVGEALAQELGLSEEKTAEIKQLMEQHRQEITVLQKARQQAQQELDQLFQAETLNQQAINATTDKLVGITEQMTRATIKNQMAVNSALTPEQRGKMQQLRKQKANRFKQQERVGDKDRAQKQEWSKQKQKDKGKDNP